MAKRKGGNVLLWIVMGLVAVGLLGYGSGGFSRQASSIGTVDGLDVPAQAYANALGQQMQRFEEQVGQPLPFDQAQALGIDRAVLARLVSDRALDAEVARLGLSVGDARVAEAVRAAPGFQGIAGGFDRDLYAEQLRRNGLTESEFEASLREDTARTLLQAAVVGGVPAPQGYADALAGWQGERRTITWATLTSDAVAATLPAPTDAELRAYYEANPDAFTAPEVRDVAYAWLTPAMLLDEVEVPEADVRALYDERVDEFVQEERRLVERLAFGTEAEAAEARARLDAGEATFEDVVEGRGLALSDIDLGDVSRGELGPAGEAAFAAQPGDVVGPIVTDLGPALFRVNAVLAADEVPFAEAAPDLRDEIADGIARARIDDVVAGLEDLLAGGATVADLAERTDLEPGTLAWSEGATEGIAAYDAVRAAVAAAQPGGDPALVPLEDGGVAVLRVDDVTPPALRPFEEVAAQVAEAQRAEALAEAVLAEATARAEAIAGGASFEDQGLVPVTEPPLTRRDVVEGTTPAFIETAFGLAQGAAAALPAGADALVLRLASVAAPAEDDPAAVADRAAISGQAAESLAQDLLATFAAQVQAAAEVRVDDAAVAAVNAQFQ